MDNLLCLKTIDDFMKEHPEIDSSTKSLIEPLVKESEDEIYNFIMNFIFL